MVRTSRRDSTSGVWLVHPRSLSFCDQSGDRWANSGCPTRQPVPLTAETPADLRRGGGIRTHDLFVPNEARYQAALHPDGAREAKPRLGGPPKPVGETAPPWLGANRQAE